jgi:hypothetical protein
MIHRFGSEPAQTRSSFGGTLTAGGGWAYSPPGWGRAREHGSGRAR